MTTSALIQKFKDTLRGNLLSDQDQELGADAPIVAELNLAQNEIARWCGFTKPAVPCVIQAPTYAYTIANLNATNRVRRIIRAWNPLDGTDFRPLPIIDLISEYPTYITSTTESAPYGLWVDNKTAVFYPAPADATTYYLHAECDPAELSASALSAEPELDDDLHVHIARLAAARVSSINILTNDQASSIDRIEREAKDAAASVRDTTLVNI